MAQDSNVRSALPHPPGLLPAYFTASAFDGVPVAEPGKPKSRLLELYDRLLPGYFAELPPELDDADLAWLDGFLLSRLETEREERRMHFGAFALVSVLFFILLPQLMAMQFANLALDLLALLLLVLLVPYVFVYFGYENRVRALAVGHMRLVEARARRAQERAGAASSAA